MSMLNWTGLVVNGLVAFLLPMILALKTLGLRSERTKEMEMIVHSDPETVSETVGLTADNASSETDRLLSSENGILSRESRSTKTNSSLNHTGLIKDRDSEMNDEESLETAAFNTDGEYHLHLNESRMLSTSSIQPLPYWLEDYRREIILFMIFTFATIIILTIVEDAIEGIAPPPEE